jgi:hypothetical protein
VKIRLTKKRNSVLLRFSAESDTEGVELKDIVLALAKNGISIDGAVKEFKARGYTATLTKETPNTKEFTLSRSESEAS